MLAVVALAEQSLDLEHQVTKRDQAVVEVERKLQIASSGALLAQYSALTTEKQVRIGGKELEDVE